MTNINIKDIPIIANAFCDTLDASKSYFQPTDTDTPDYHKEIIKGLAFDLIINLINRLS